MKTQRMFAAGLALAAGGACSSAADAPPPFQGPAGAFGSPTPAAIPTPASFQPQFGPASSLSDAPPPISGGTLAVAADGNTVVASDPDRDRVYVIDLENRSVRFDVALPSHAEPGRVALDDSGSAYVVLRRRGGVAVVDLATGALSFIEACRTPRGIAFDRKVNALRVACADGNLLTLSKSTPAIARIKLDPDLRDVVVLDNGELLVTRFRSADFLRVTAQGTVERQSPPGSVQNLAWRAIAAPLPPSVTNAPGARAAAVVAQQPSDAPVTPSGWGGGGAGTVACATGQRVTTQLTLLGRGAVLLPFAVLPVDLASNGEEYAVVAAGNAFTPTFSQLFIVPAMALFASSSACAHPVEGNVPGQAIAAAFAAKNALVVQTREPAALHIMTEDRQRAWKSIPLSNVSRFDTGHAIFHSNSGNQIACASCHAEGGDDGRVWQFVDQGSRRTPALRGTLEGTAPYHWGGDIPDVSTLAAKVFVAGMGGPQIDPGQVDSLQRWLFALPAPAPLHDADAASDRGKVIFEDRCTRCHSGPRFTNNRTVDVGTGGQFQVPSLVGVAWRTPLLHTGCATTLRDRFNLPCGGNAHASDLLAPTEIDDLVHYLETL